MLNKVNKLRKSKYKVYIWDSIPFSHNQKLISVMYFENVDLAREFFYNIVNNPANTYGAQLFTHNVELNHNIDYSKV